VQQPQNFTQNVFYNSKLISYTININVFIICIVPKVSRCVAGPLAPSADQHQHCLLHLTLVSTTQGRTEQVLQGERTKDMNRNICTTILVREQDSFCLLLKYIFSSYFSLYHSVLTDVKHSIEQK
jgi:hypothetical protein